MAENNGQSSTAIAESEQAATTTTNGQPKAKGSKKKTGRMSATLRRAKATRPKEKKAKVKWSFPRYTLEQALKLPHGLKEFHGGNPWEPEELRMAIGAPVGNAWFYLSAASRDYGLTIGTRDADKKVVVRQTRKRP